MTAGVLARRTGRAMHTPRSAARAAGVTKSAIYRAIKSGRLPARKLNGGRYAIYPAELLRSSRLAGRMGPPFPPIQTDVVPPRPFKIPPKPAVVV